MQDWVEVARRGENHHVLYVDLMCQTMASNAVGKTFAPEFNFTPAFRQFDGARWFSKDDFQRYLSLMRKASGERKVLKMGLDWELQSEKTRAFADTIKSRDFAGATTSQLVEAFDGFCNAAIAHWGHAYHYMMLNRFLPDEVAAEVAKKVPDEEQRSKFLQLLFSTEKPTEIKRENSDLLRLAAKLHSEGKSIGSEEASRLIEAHLAKYAHLGRYYLRSKPYSKEQMDDRVRQLPVHELNEKIARAQEELQAPNKSRQLMSELKLSEELVQKILAVKQFAYASNYADESYGYLVECCSRLLEEIGRRLGLTWDELCSMRSAEIQDWLTSQTVPSPAIHRELAVRQKDHAIIHESGQIKLVWGPELDAYREKERSLEPAHVEHSKQLKGLGASPAGQRARQ